MLTLNTVKKLGEFSGRNGVSFMSQGRLSKLRFIRIAGRDKSESALNNALESRPNSEHEFLANLKETEMKVFL